MTLPKFDYAEPKSLRQASALLRQQRGKAMLIAGGTDLLQALKNRLKTPALLVDLKNIPRLDHISYSEKTGLQIGAMVSLRQLANSAVIKEKYPMLVEAALAVGTAQLQAMGTVGGNLCQDSLCQFYDRSPMARLMLEPCLKLGGHVCHAVSGSNKCWANYSGDLAPALLALHARVTIADSTEKKKIPLSKLYSDDGKRPTRLRAGQILTEIHVPPPAPHSGSAYLKLRLRKTIDYALLGVALYLSMEDGDAVCKDIALALTGVGKAPFLVKEAEQLKGKQVGDAEIAQVAEAAFKQAHPLSNIGGLTPAYRKEMVRVYVRKAFGVALESAGQDA